MGQLGGRARAHVDGFTCALLLYDRARCARARRTRLRARISRRWRREARMYEFSYRNAKKQTLVNSRLA
eukprot:4654989-Prymnesium_polylepis.1